MDPYQVLGVSPNASDDEIRQAYRSLAKKYHPDNYVNSPLADVAAEKMKQINAAYDEIRQMRSGSGQNAAQTSRSGAGSSGSGKNTSDVYARIRTCIASGYLDMAQELLQRTPAREAEWFFLAGSLCYRRGQFDRACTYFRQAVSMEPGNPEYQAALDQLNRQRSIYRDHNPTDLDRSLDMCRSCAACFGCLSCFNCTGRWCF